MKSTLFAIAALALLSATASANTSQEREFTGECVNVVANYENAAPTKCTFYDSNTPAMEIEKKKSK